MNRYPRIAVFLATYNGEKFLNEQIDSILSQKNVAVDIYCNDDGSTDSTIEVLNNYQKNNDNFFLLDTIKNSGSAGRNFYSLIMSHQESYDFYAFSDQDDVWLDNKLETAYKKIIANYSDGYSANHIAFWNQRKLKIYKDTEQTNYDYMFESAGAGCTYVLTKKLFIDFRNFVNANTKEISRIFKHDWLIYAFARSRNYKWYLDNEFTLMYRQHENNETGVNTGQLDSFLTRLKNIKSGWFSQQISYLSSVLGYRRTIEILLPNSNIFKRLVLYKVFMKIRRKKRDAIVLYILYVLGIFKFNESKELIKFHN